MGMTANQKAALTVGALVVGGGLYFLIDALTDPDPTKAPVPKALGERLSVVVKTLNKKLGNAWGQRALVDLKAVLAAALPGWEVTLVNFVYAAERHGTQREWKGEQKLAHALHLAGG